MDGPKQMLWNIFRAIVGPSILKHHRQEMSLFSSIIITIILTYAIIRIYIILHIYLQVSETESQAGLNWVIGNSVLEQINSIYLQCISLAFSRMFF